MNTQRTSAVALASWLMLAGWAAAEPLAVFECREIVGRDWPRTLVTYQREFARGQARANNLRLLDSAGQEQPVQFWRVKMHEDGSLASARISFYAELAQDGNYRYTLETGAPGSASSVPKATVERDVLTLDNGQVALRLPSGDRKFTGQPLAMVQDRATAVQNLGGLEKAGLAFGPIAGIRLADGQWVGGSYFTTESIEAVRFRQMM